MLQFSGVNLHPQHGGRKKNALPKKCRKSFSKMQVPPQNSKLVPYAKRLRHSSFSVPEDATPFGVWSNVMYDSPVRPLCDKRVLGIVVVVFFQDGLHGLRRLHK